MTMFKRGAFLIFFIALVIWPLNQSYAQQMEFNLGLAYDHPFENPLPELTDGFGYNFTACFWIHNRVGLAVGAIGTRHDINGGIYQSQSIKIDAERDMLFLEGRLRFYKSKKYELIGHLGYTFSNNIHGGDTSGSYLQYREEYYDSYDSEDLGYKGSGFWLGTTLYRGITSYHSGYYLFASIRYSYAKYNRVIYYDDSLDFLQSFETDADEVAHSLSVILGIVFRFDFANF